MSNSNPSSSSINRSHTSFNSPHDYNQDDVQEEESGWTSYFDDFFSNKTSHPSALKHIDDHLAYDEEDGNNYYGGSGSLVSDAASGVAWKSQHKYSDGSSSTRAEALAACSSFDGTQMVIHKKLRFKKNINNHKRSSDYLDDSLEDTASSPVNSPKTKGDVYGYYDHEGQKNELKQQVMEAKKSLKEKGLCLVPFSTLINYIG